MCEILVYKMFVCAMPFFPSFDCFTMKCHCLRWLCARCLCYRCMSGVSVLYVCVYNICLQDIYPRCLCIRWLCGGCGCAASLCVSCPNLKCLPAECLWPMSVWGRLCGFNILFVIESFVLDASVRDVRVWMDEFSLCVSGISALDECLLDNCLKNVRVLNA